MSELCVIGIENPMPEVSEILREAGLHRGGPTMFGNSFWSAFELCAYDAMLTRLGNRTGSSNALTIGIIVHDCLALWYETRQYEMAVAPCACLEQYCAKMMETWPREVEQLWACVGEARGLVESYLRRWMPFERANARWSPAMLAQVDFPLESIVKEHVEIEITARDGASGFTYSGRLDVVPIIRDYDGSWCAVVVDHKTFSIPESQWADVYWQDPQVPGYVYLWDTYARAKGLPPARYVLMNGLQKPSSGRQVAQMVRELYPVRPARMEVWKTRMRLLYAEWVERKGRFDALVASGQPFDLWDVFPMRWSACRTRPFGRGECARIADCLNISRYEVPRPVVTQTPAPAVQEVGAPPSVAVSPGTLPTGSEPAAPPVGAGNDVVAASPLPPVEGPTSSAAEPPTATEAWAPPPPCPDEAGMVTSFSSAEEPEVSARECRPGYPYFVRSNVAWATGRFNDKGEPLFELPGLAPDGGHPLLGVAPDAPALLVTPVFRGPDTVVPKGSEEIVFAKLGEVPMAEVGGMVPIVSLGSFVSGGLKRLSALLDKAQPEGPCYGVALVGRDESKRKMNLVARVNGEVVKRTSGDVGKTMWKRFEAMVAPPESPAPPPPPEPPVQPDLPNTDGGQA